VNGKITISFEQFLTINSNLVHISDTWSDLWALIFYTGLSVGRLIDLRYTDIEGGVAYLREKGRLKAKQIELSVPVCTILKSRRMMYPQDIFVFQSHSNRVKNKCSPVTIIAFNTALRKSSKLATGGVVSSKNARKVVC
jgi:integrase